MKKIFLIPLLACSFCICAYANSAKIGTTDYPTVTAAIATVDENAADWTTIVLTGNELEYIVIPANKKIILNLNGHSIQSEGDEEAWDLKNCCTIYNQGSLRIIEEGDGMVSSPAKAGMNSCPIVNASTGELIIDGGVFVAKAVYMEMTGVTFGMPVIWGEQTGNKVTINGGIFVQQPVGTKFTYQVVNSINDEDFTVNGGDFNNNQDTKLVNNVSDGHVGEWIDFSGTYDGVRVTSVYHVYAASTGTTYSADTEITEDVETTDVMVKSGVTVTLTKDHKITCKTLALEDENAKLIIEGGATVIVEDEIRAGFVNNIHMTMDAREGGDGFSNLLIKAREIQDANPLATVTLKSKAYRKENGQYVFQRFAVPTYPGSDTQIARKDIGYVVPTAMYGWDYATESWKYMDSESVFEPFQCYDMTIQSKEDTAKYVFECKLVGNGNVTLPLQGHWNYYANSYTAPIDIAKVIDTLYNYYDNISSSVYVHHAEGDYWDQVNYAQVIRDKMLQKKIEPMQAFVFERLDAEGENPVIDYTKFIYNPFMGITPNNAPRRNAPVQLDFAYATMKIEAADGSRNTMEMYEGNQFDASFDNGFDVTKHMNENCFNMYFVAQEGNMAYLASDNVANTAITLDTKEATSYTVNFEDVTMEGYALRDNLTGTETEIVSGNTYSFSAPANSKIEGRFEIVAIAKMPTAIDDVEVNANVKGIYTLTGQYLGENFHVLPAGVYVINGKKVVK